MSISVSKRWPPSESELAAVVVRWLREQEWEVFQEVQATRGGRRADIVAKRGRLLWAIEAKRSLSLALLEQGVSWQWRAHHVSVAFPLGKGRGMGLAVCKWKGLGALAVTEDRVVERLAPRLNRRIGGHLADVLVPQQADYAPAGNAGGAFWSPFKETCQNVLAFVREHPGCTSKELVEGVDHHYHSSATARSALLHWVGAGKIPGIRVEVEKRRARYYPV